MGWYLLLILGVFCVSTSAILVILAGVLLALLGIALLTLTNPLGSNVLFGLVSGVFTALTYSVFIILLKYLEQFQTTAQQTLFWVAVVTALFLLGPTLAEDGLALPDFRAVAILMVHALVSSVLGWWMIVIALRKVPVAVVSTLLLLQPLLTNIWGHLYAVCGMRCAVCGMRYAVCGMRYAVCGMRFGEDGRKGGVQSNFISGGAVLTANVLRYWLIFAGYSMNSVVLRTTWYNR